MYKKKETQRGITLIALVITIIVMLMLVGVTISMAVNGGLFDYAGKATGETKNALNAEQDLANGGLTIGNTYYNSIDEYLDTKNGETTIETISKEKNEYIGCYADVDADGTPDGIIYEDLAFREGYYEEGTVLKDYYVSGTYDGVFNEEGESRKVLTATGEGNDRFYVMALEDFTDEGSVYHWYQASSAYDEDLGEYNITEVVTSTAFGTGKENTETMIEKWNASAFGEQCRNETCQDIWGPIQPLVAKGWFVPSCFEWYAFMSAIIPYDESLWTYTTYRNGRLLVFFAGFSLHFLLD